MDVDVSGEATQVGHRLAENNHTRDGVSLSFEHSDLGEGELGAVLVRDRLCIDGAASCVDMTMLAATNMTDQPFRRIPSDGIVGLGLDGLTACPTCSFVGRLLEGSTGVLPQFGLAFGADRGELHLGGHSRAKLAGPLRWFPVDHPEAGFWQVAIQAVRVGNKTIDDCRAGCHGIIDSSTSRLGVQASKMASTRMALTASTLGGKCHGPDLSFDLGGLILTLTAEDYAGGPRCEALLGRLNLEEPDFVGVYTFGDMMLRRYYTAFDWNEKRLGFAPLGSDSDSHSTFDQEAVVVV